MIEAQGKQNIIGGIGRGSEEEHDIDPEAAREYLQAPSKLLDLDSPIIQRLIKCDASQVFAYLSVRMASCEVLTQERGPCSANSYDFVHLCRQFNLKELVCQGGFRNVRKDFDWTSLKLELDETIFDWGTLYEIEVETVRLYILSWLS